MTTISNVHMEESLNDLVVWKFIYFGRYFCHSLRLELHNDISIALSWKLLWSIPTPLKIRFFIWMHLWGRFSFRDRLTKFGVISHSSNVCSFCKSHE